MYTVIRQGQTQIVTGIRRTSDQAFIPLDSGNCDYAAFLEWNAAQSPPLNTDDGPELDYLILKDGAMELADGAEVSLAGDGVAVKTITAQYKNANDSDGTGAGETVGLSCAEPTPLDKTSAVLNGSGQITFQAGPTTLKGTFVVLVSSGEIPGRTLRIKFT
jgi:hypothetical protein